LTTDIPEFPPLENSPPAADSFDETVLAGFWSRLAAFAIDLAIIAIILYITTAAAAAFFRVTHNTEVWGSASFYLFAGLFYNFFTVVYFVYFTAEMGRTPGKAAAGLKVVDLSGSEAGYVRALFRALGYYLSSLFFMAGFLWFFLDRRRQTWHDKLAGTIVVEI